MELSSCPDETILGLGKSARDGRAGPNSRHDVHAQEILAHADCFAPSWREFVRYHVSNTFFQELLGLMGAGNHGDPSGVGTASGSAVARATDRRSRRTRGG